MRSLAPIDELADLVTKLSVEQSMSFKVDKVVGLTGSDYTYDSAMVLNHYSDAVNGALASAEASEGSVRSKGEIVTFTSASGKLIVPRSNTAWRGSGIDKTLINSARPDYVIKNTTNPLTNFSMSDMTIDTQNLASASGAEFRLFTNLDLARLKFKNSSQWFLKFGNEPGASSSDINRNLHMSDIVMDGHAGIYEMLLIYNTEDVLIERCFFRSKSGSAGSAPTIGFWQKVQRVRLSFVTFENLVGSCMYYSYGSNYIEVDNVTAINTGQVLRGANVADNGKFGYKSVSGIKARRINAFGGANSGATEAIQLGSASQFEVDDVYIDSYAKGIRLGFGNAVPTAGGDGGDASYPSGGGIISNVAFRNINPLGTSKTLNSPFYFSGGADHKLLIILNAQVYDPNNNLDYAVIFNGKTTATATVSGGIITSISVDLSSAGYPTAWYDIAPEVVITGDGTGATATSTLDSFGRIASVTVTNGGSGYTTATVGIPGGVFKNIRFIGGNFGGKKILVNDNCQVDWATVTFENVANLDTSNLSATARDLAIKNSSSFVQHDGRLGVALATMDANASFQVGDGTSTVRMRYNNIQDIVSNDNLQHLHSASFTGRIEAWYKGSVSVPNQRLLIDIDNGRLAIGAFSPTAFLDLAASLATSASLRLRSGVVPTSPNDGDVWNDSTSKSIRTRTNGITGFIEKILYTHNQYNVVVNTAAETSAIGSSKGVGSLALPANFWVAGKRIQLNLKGTYQTPMLPNQVVVKIKVGSVVVAQVTVAASIFAASSTVKGLFGEAVISCQSVTSGVAKLVCDGMLMFEMGTGAVAVPFNTAASVAAGSITASSGTSGATATVDYTVANSGLVDVTETWSAAQAGQGTTISNGKLTEES